MIEHKEPTGEAIAPRNWKQFSWRTLMMLSVVAPWGIAKIFEYAQEQKAAVTTPDQAPVVFSKGIPTSDPYRLSLDWSQADGADAEVK